MRVIKPMIVDNTALDASNVSEDDYAEWAGGTTYAQGDRVIVIGTTHKVYESQQNSNTGNDPTTDTSFTWWNPVSATNRWKAFDQKISDQVTKTGTITYTILSASRITGAAFFGLSALTTRVVVKDSGAATIFDEERDMSDTSDIIDWFTFYTWEPTYNTEAIFSGLPAYATYTVEITIDAGAETAKVGQIVLGDDIKFGTTLDGTQIGLLDFSRKDRDEFGNPVIIERASSDTVDFNFSFPTNDANRIRRELTTLRAKPAVYYAGAETENFGTTVYGFFNGFEVPLSAGGTSFAELEIEGLI